MVLILWASPNEEGLTAACFHAAQKGIESAGGQCQSVQLTDLELSACRQCGNGWGTCRTGHECCLEDSFPDLHSAITQADALIVITPVYWGDMAETVKNVFDRLRRCEAIRREESGLHDKYLLAVAAAGGSGNGTLSCLTQMERLTQHMGMRMFDAVPVKRITREYQLATIQSAASALQTALTQG